MSGQKIVGPPPRRQFKPGELALVIAAHPSAGDEIEVTALGFPVLEGEPPVKRKFRVHIRAAAIQAVARLRQGKDYVEIKVPKDSIHVVTDTFDGRQSAEDIDVHEEVLLNADASLVVVYVAHGGIEYAIECPYVSAPDAGAR